MADLHSKPDARAFCHNCDWTCFAANAHGAGALHAKKHDHYVTVEVFMMYGYNRAAMPKRPEADVR